MTEGIQLPDYEGLWEEAPLYPDLLKPISDWLGTKDLVLYRRIPYGPVPTLLVGDRVEFKRPSEQSVVGCDQLGFVLEERPEFAALIAHGRGNTLVISKDAIEAVWRNGGEIWRRKK